MKRRMLLLAAMGCCLIRVELMWAQVRGPVRLVFDQAHGEQPPPDQLSVLAKKFGLQVQTPADAISGKYWGKDSAIFMEELLAWLAR